MSTVPSAGPSKTTAARPPRAGFRAGAFALAGFALASGHVSARAQVAPGPVAPTPVDASVDALARLRAVAPGARVAPGLVTGLHLELPGETPTDRARAFIAGHPGLFPVGAAGSLVPGVERGRSVRFDQHFGGLPVRGGGVTFAFDARGRLKGYTDEVRPVVSATPATLDATAAIAAARTQLGVPATPGAPPVRAALIVQSGLAMPVFEVDLLVSAPFDVRRVLVDAVAGRVIGQEAQVHR